MIFSSRPRFPKPVQSYKILNFFGNNIVTTDFDEWKRYRKIAAPAFNEVRDYQYIGCRHVSNDSSQKNNKLAFEESVRVVTSLYEGRWDGKQEIVADDTLDLTMAVSSANVAPNEDISIDFLRRL